MVFFHPHEGGVVIRLGIAVPFTANMLVSCVSFQPLEPFIDRFPHLLQLALPLPGPIHEFYLFLRPLLPQLLPQLLQVVCLRAFRDVVLDADPVQHVRQFFPNSLLETGTVLLYSLLPHECILVRIGLYFRAVNEDVRQIYFSHPAQYLHQLFHQLVLHLWEILGTEPCDRIVIRRIVSLQKIHEADVFPTCSLDLSAAEYASHIPIYQQLCKNPRRILDSPILGVARSKYVPIHPFKDCVQYPYRVILRDHDSCVDWKTYLIFPVKYLIIFPC